MASLVIYQKCKENNINYTQTSPRKLKEGKENIPTHSMRLVLSQCQNQKHCKKKNLQLNIPCEHESPTNNSSLEHTKNCTC